MRSLVKVRLAERRMTQRQLCEAAGVSKDTMWRMTTDEGIGRVTLARLVRVADALGCDVTDLYDTRGGEV